MKTKIISAICITLVFLQALSALALCADVTDGASDTESTAVDTVSDTEADSTTANTSAGGEDPLEEPRSVQSIVYNFLTEELSLSPAVAAGIMGNVMIECGFDPDLEVIDTNDKPSYGLMMWNGPRYEALKKYCKENGFEKSDPEGQLRYLKWELENTEKAVMRKLSEIPNTIEGAVRATILWASDFERCTKTSYGLRVFYTLNNYWQKYAGGTVSDTQGIYGYYYNAPDNIKYGTPLTLYGVVVSYSSSLKSVTAGVYTDDGELLTGKTISASNLAGNIGVIDRYIVFNKLPRGSYYYTITAVNEAGEYIVERRSFTVSDDPTASTLIPESEGGVICELGISCPSLSYKDMLPAKHWAHSGVDFVSSRGYFKGDSNGYFSPKTDMNRAMAVTVLNRIADWYGIELMPIDQPGDGSDMSSDGTGGTDEPSTPPADGETSDTESDLTSSSSDSSTSDTNEDIPTEAVTSSDLNAATGTAGNTSDTSEGKHNGGATDSTDPSESTGENQEIPLELPFTDIEDGRWYTKSVLWAAEYGIVKGKGEGTFDPGGTLSRGELATVMFRFATSIGLDTTGRADLAVFADGDTVPRWAQDGISWAVDAKLINGASVNGVVSVDYASPATREQVATIITRLASIIDAFADNHGDETAS